MTPALLAVLALLALALALCASLVLLTVRTVHRVEAMLPPAGRFIEVPGARLHVVERGQGPAVLLVHGLAGQLCHFTYGIVDQLAAHYRVVAVDRPGSGYSARIPGASAALGAQADVLAALIDTLQLGRTVVVGHSLGGAIALALAQRHPERVAGLALVAPLTHPVTGVAAVFKVLQIAKPWLRTLVAWTLAVPLGMARRDEMLGLIFAPEAVPSDFGTRGGGMLAMRPSHFIAACTDLAAIPQDLPGMVQRYGTMQMPVSILYGRGDAILDPQAQGEALAAELPGARLTLVDGGHMLPITAPDRVAQFIRESATAA
ncbi:MAG TPA: alpha/beta hydrolase [Steroidobacteraceae bacterium]|nr:alpha/beta hydrolase [Steroidobacteraceae bacterium]